MEHWFLPIKFLPAIGLFILSTANMSTSLNMEIDNLMKSKDVPKRIFLAQLRQHTRLAIAQVLLYISSFCFALAGLIGVTLHDLEKLFHTLLIIGVIIVIASFVFLSIFAFKSVSIRKDQHSLQ